MHTLLIAIPVVAVVTLFIALSLSGLIDRRDPALQAERPAPARQPAAQRRPWPRFHSYPLAHAHSFVPDSAHPAQPAAQPKERKLHMHTATGLRWLSLFIFMVLLGGALAMAAAPAWAAEAQPTAVVTTGRLNVRTGPGVSYTIVTRIDKGTSVTLLARNSAATWVKFRLASGLEGWVNASYVRASVLIGDLPVNGTPVSPTPTPVTGTVTAAQLELRAGPGGGHGLVATLRQGQALTLLGRNAEGTWVKVKAGSQEGWVPAQITVILPGNENGVTTAPFSASVAISSLLVVGSTAPAAPSGPRVSLSGSSVRPATPVFITVAGFPANHDIAAVLTSRSVPAGFVVATSRTDASGNAQLFFRQPDTWPGGAAISDAALSLAVGTTDGAVLVWNGLAYRP